jgi:Txe/YoeB family toxin of toxin-antitoxin system
VSWKIVFTRQAQKDATVGLKPKAEQLLKVLQADPFQDPPPFEKLVGDLAGAYSRRINIQRRLVYQVPWIQLPSATVKGVFVEKNTSNGVLNPRVFLGR